MSSDCDKVININNASLLHSNLKNFIICDLLTSYWLGKKVGQFHFFRFLAVADQKKKSRAKYKNRHVIDVVVLHFYAAIENGGNCLAVQFSYFINSQMFNTS